MHSGFMNKKANLPTLYAFIVMSFMIILINSEANSPLRFGTDTYLNDISITYYVNPFQKNQSLYITSFHPATDLLQSNDVFSFCFLQQNIIQMEAESFNCQLTNNRTYYDCLTIENKAGNSNLSYQYWQMDLNNVIINGSSEYTPINPYEGSETNGAAINIGLKGTTNQTLFNYLQTANAFYKVLTTNSKSFNEDTFKVNYLSTFSSTFNEEYNKSSQNILLQRFPYCFLSTDDEKDLSVYNLIFVGGVTRNSFPVYMMSFIHFEVNYNKFIMWEGLAFSSDKANRDMIGIRPINGVVQDLFCLFARAPWTDNSSNIGGAQNIVVMSTSSTITYTNVSWFYQTNILRPYQTDDSVADESLIFKLNNKYCYVYSFLKTQTQDLQYSYLDNGDSNMHKAPLCFEPDLDIFENMNHLRLLLLAIFIMIIF